MLEGEERDLKDQQLVGTYRREGDEDDDLAEWVVAVEWQKTLPREMAFWKPGMFANQNTATRLRHQFTISQVSQAFDLDDWRPSAGAERQHCLSSNLHKL